jgi:hypothetical protein
MSALAAGAVLASLADSVMPEAYSEGGPLVAFATSAGFLVAYALTTLDRVGDAQEPMFRHDRSASVCDPTEPTNQPTTDNRPSGAPTPHLHGRGEPVRVEAERKPCLVFREREEVSS